MNVVVTSFSPDGYEKYGRNFISSFMRYWDWPLVVFHENSEPDMKGPTYIDLLKDQDLLDFLRYYDTMPAAHGIAGMKDGKPVADYRLQAVRFARKVFALTTLPLEKVDWWVWIDADTETTSKIDRRFVDAACPQKGLISYLGRKDWDHSECGFVAYRVGHPVPLSFLRDFRRAYTTGEIFKFPQWHDSYIFDRIMEMYAPWKPFFVNLSEGVPGNHVWPHTILGEYMVHNKGGAKETSKDTIRKIVGRNADALRRLADK